MGERKYTPGPWRYLCGQVEAVTDGRPGLVVRRKIADISIAYMASDERDANAALIAAAPDMAEASGALLAKLDQFAAEIAEPMFVEERETSRAALKSARGE